MSEHDDVTVGKILDRRQILRMITFAGAGVFGLDQLLRNATLRAAIEQPADKVDLVATPVLTEGPFFVDEKLNRSDLVSDTQRPTVTGGLPLLLNLTVYELVDKKLSPMKDAYVDLWHTDSIGVYSDENNPMNHENTADQRWLRGYQVTDGDGKVAFKTIVPGWYSGRTAHIHFKVRQFSAEHKATAEFTSQFFFNDADSDRIFAKPPYNNRGQRHTNAHDGIYSEKLADGTTAGDRLTLSLENNPTPPGLVSSYGIVLTQQTLHGRGGRGRGPGGRGPGGPPPFGRPPGPPPDAAPFGPPPDER